MINIKEFLNSKRIIHSEKANDSISGLQFLIENEKIADIITFNTCIQFSLVNVSDLKKNIEGFYFYEYNMKRIGDIVDNIKVESLSNSKYYITYNIGDINYTTDKINEFILLLAPYQNFKIRITFLETPNQHAEFIISLRQYFIDNKSNTELLSFNCVCSDSGVYNGGIYNIDSDNLHKNEL